MVTRKMTESVASVAYLFRTDFFQMIVALAITTKRASESLVPDFLAAETNDG